MRTLRANDHAVLFVALPISRVFARSRTSRLHERALPSRPPAVRNLQRLPVWRATNTSTRATLPLNALLLWPVLQTRSIERPLSFTRLRVTRACGLLTLERGSTRSPHTELPGPVRAGAPCGSGGLAIAWPQPPPAGVGALPPFCRATYACEPKLFFGLSPSFGLLFSGSPGSAIATHPFAGLTATVEKSARLRLPGSPGISPQRMPCVQMSS